MFVGKAANPAGGQHLGLCRLLSVDVYPLSLSQLGLLWVRLQPTRSKIPRAGLDFEFASEPVDANPPDPPFPVRLLDSLFRRVHPFDVRPPLCEPRSTASNRFAHDCLFFGLCIDGAELPASFGSASSREHFS